MTTILATGWTPQHDSMVSSWCHRFDRSPLRGPAAQPAREYVGFVRGLVETLVVAMASEPGQLRPGSVALRELEKTTAFAGAALATSSTSGFEIAAIMLALRDTVLEYADIDLREPLTALFEWLTIVAMDAHGLAGRRAVRERAAEELEAGTPVVLLTSEIPAVFLVGAPPADVLDGLFARAMLLIVRVGAASLILDASGLSDDHAAPVLVAIGRLLAHPRLATVDLVVVGLRPETLSRWQELAQRSRVAMRPFERFDAALAYALDRAGLALIRRG